MKKLRARNITRTIDVATCEVSIYERETKQVTEVTAFVTGYTEPDEILQYLSELYNTDRFVMLDYTVVRKRVIKATMNEESFRVNADRWSVIRDEVLKTTAEEIEG